MRRITLGQWFSFFFNATGRIGRAEYALGVGFVYACSFAIVFLAAGQAAPGAGLTLGILVSIPLLVAVLVLAAKRCHDIGLPGSFVLLLVVPVVGVIWLIALAVIHAKPGANAYGPEPTYLS